jgi:signal peptidase I
MNNDVLPPNSGPPTTSPITAPTAATNSATPPPLPQSTPELATTHEEPTEESTPQAVGTVESSDDENSDSGGSRRENARSILSTVAILIIAPLIALTLTAFVFQSYEVDGPSMQTTLHNQDRLIVYKLPKTLARLEGHDYIPNRGDIVIFTKQDSLAFGTDQSRQLIKRVIALPGERVVVKDGKITVYNKAHPNGFDPDDNPLYSKVIVTTPGDIDLTVPPGDVYVCGDNRPDSLDSRSFGPIAAKDIVGRLVLRVYPFSQSRVF